LMMGRGRAAARAMKIFLTTSPLASDGFCACVANLSSCRLFSIGAVGGAPMKRLREGELDLDTRAWIVLPHIMRGPGVTKTRKIKARGNVYRRAPFVCARRGEEKSRAARNHACQDDDSSCERSRARQDRASCVAPAQQRKRRDGVNNEGEVKNISRGRTKWRFRRFAFRKVGGDFGLIALLARSKDDNKHIVAQWVSSRSCQVKNKGEGRRGLYWVLGIQALSGRQGAQ